MNRREFIKLVSSVVLVPSLEGIPFEYQSIPTVFAEQFSKNLYQLCQQKDSRLRKVVA